MRNYYGQLKRFPLGAIRAEGFLRDQMLRGKDGMAGHLYELEPGIIADPYIKRSTVDSWGSIDQLGWGAEISGNFWSGYIQYAFTLGDEEMIRTASAWVDKMLQRQREDGYLGTYDAPDANVFEDYNAWGTMCVMRGLIAFYEVTKRADVLDAAHKCMLWFTKTWAGDKKPHMWAPRSLNRWCSFMSSQAISAFLTLPRTTPNSFASMTCLTTPTAPFLKRTYITTPITQRTSAFPSACPLCSTRLREKRSICVQASASSPG